jgi:hypothetical protein
MAVNFEIKGMLARLLATEDIIVEHKNVDTACFNVHTRCLTLPLWERASSGVYDLLCAHEVGHSRETPDVDVTSFGVPHQFINIVEDVRVEKLIKRRYMGLSKTFFNGYKELHEKDFFCLENENIDEMNLADRVNLYFKVGHFIDVKFTQEEQELVNELGEIETFDDTIELAKKLYEFCKKQQQEQTKLPEANSHGQRGSGNQSPQQQMDMDESGDGEDNGDNRQNDQSSQQQSQSAPEQQSGGSQADPIGQQEEPKVKTADALQQAIQDLLNPGSYENDYVEIQQLNLDSVIAKNKEIHDYIEDHFVTSQRTYDEALKINTFLSPRNIFEVMDTEYQKFRTSAQKEVNYLVKEFECRKSADAYSRATVSKTGVLDCSKLHTYKYNEDLFKKVTTIAEGKNHGLIFILDWSGSMNSVLMDTIKQLFNLVWFCKKVGIPFDVYAFTGEWSRVSYDENHKLVYPQSHYQKKAGVFQVSEQFTLMNFLTSKVNGNTLEKQMKNIWRVVYGLRNGYSGDYPHRLSLSGTPLNETMIALHSIIPHFQKQNKVQKLQCVILTDGDASPIPYHVEIQKSKFTEPYIGTRRVSPGSTFLRDRKLGTTYKFEYEYYQFTDVLLRNLCEKFPWVNFIGMRIMEGRDAGYIIDRYCGSYGQEHDKSMSTWKKDKSFFTQKTAYTGYFGLSSTALNQDAEFEVAEDATKAQIKSAFAKSLKSKKLNKKVLGEFVNLIA